MSKKYIKKSSFVNGEQFKVSNGTWPEGVVIDPTSPTGYVYKYLRMKNIKEEPGDPEPVEIEVKIPISDRDYLYNGLSGKKSVKSEFDFLNEYEEL
jgi:hypothetical protein